MVAMEVAAAKATEDPREGRARRKARKAASQTVRTGERKRVSTEWKNSGWEGISGLFWKREGMKRSGVGDLQGHRRG